MNEVLIVKVPWYAKLSLVVAGSFLLTYPLIFTAAVMSLAGFESSDTPSLLSVVAQIFIWLTVLYPLVYIVFVVLFLRKKFSRRRSLYAYAPMLYLFLCVIFFFLWLAVEEYYYEPVEYSDFSNSSSITDEELDVWFNSGEVE